MREIPLVLLVVVAAGMLACRGVEHRHLFTMEEDLAATATAITQAVAAGDEALSRSMRVDLEVLLLDHLFPPHLEFGGLVSIDAWRGPVDAVGGLRDTFRRYGGSAIDPRLPELIETYVLARPDDLSEVDALVARCSGARPRAGEAVWRLCDAIDASRGTVLELAYDLERGRAIVLVAARSPRLSDGSVGVAYRRDDDGYRRVATLLPFGCYGSGYVLAEVREVDGEGAVLPGDRVVAAPGRADESSALVLSGALGAPCHAWRPPASVIEGVALASSRGTARLRDTAAASYGAALVGSRLTAWRDARPVARLVVLRVDADDIVVGPSPDAPDDPRVEAGDLVSDRFHAAPRGTRPPR